MKSVLIAGVLGMMLVVFGCTRLPQSEITPKPHDRDSAGRIIFIDQTDPAVLRLQEFANARGLKWYVRPDSNGSTWYCAGLADTKFKYKNGCSQVLSGAVAEVIENWGDNYEPRDFEIGNMKVGQ